MESQSHGIIKQHRLEASSKDHLTFCRKGSLDKIVLHPVQLHPENLQ